MEMEKKVVFSSEGDIFKRPYEWGADPIAVRWRRFCSSVNGILCLRLLPTPFRHVFMENESSNSKLLLHGRFLLDQNLHTKSRTCARGFKPSSVPQEPKNLFTAELSIQRPKLAHPAITVNFFLIYATTQKQSKWTPRAPWSWLEFRS